MKEFKDPEPLDPETLDPEHLDSNPKDQELIDLYFQSRASDKQISELERRLLASPELRTRYLDEAATEVTLRSFALREDQPIETDKKPAISHDSHNHGRQTARGFWLWRSVAAIAALLILLGMINFMRSRPGQLPDAVGSITSSDMAGWQSDQSTIDGAAFRPGTYLLQSGTATLAFDSGAEMVLIAPAKFDIISEMAVTFEYGQASFNIPESAIGFRVNMRYGKVVDHGTSFSMQLAKGGKEALLAVQKGEIAIHHSLGSVKHLTDAQVASINENQIKQIETAEGRMEVSASETPRESITLSTNGQENSIIFNNDFHNRLNRDYLLLKRHHKNRQLDRRALLGFDVSGVTLDQITGANLVLNAVPTEWRKIGHIPAESEFTLYGIPDDERENFSTGQLKWEDAPGIEAATQLASFTIKRAEARKLIQLNTPELTQFIKSDTTGKVSFMITCNTPSDWLVHGLASSQHREAAAPSLEITLAK